MAQTPGYKFTEDGAKKLVDTSRKVSKMSEGSPFQAYAKSFDDYLPGPVPFLVDLVKTSGSAGTGTTNCSFEYTMKRFGTTIVLGTNLTPLFPRDPNTQYLEAHYGLGFQDVDGTLGLMYAAEPVATDECSDGGGELDEYLP